MTCFPEPDARNGFLVDHAAILLRSFRHWTERDLIDASLAPEERARRLFEAPFAVVSHTVGDDPVFNYGNRTALALFEMSWDELTALPSHRSAEPPHRPERERLLSEVARKGFVEDYRGVRISRSGRRFLIERALVWNLLDPQDRPYGQAAMFDQWRFLT